MADASNGNSATPRDVPAVSPKAVRPPQPKPGLRVSNPSAFRRMRRSIGGTVAYLASWWRY